MTLRFRQPRVENKKHRQFVGGLPCLICHDNTTTEAAHVKLTDDTSKKRHVGGAEKADDKWTVPLCGRHHRDQHNMNEKVFWLTVGIDPLVVCEQLWAVSGDHEQGERIALNALIGDKR